MVISEGTGQLLWLAVHSQHPPSRLAGVEETRHQKGTEVLFLRVSCNLGPPTLPWGLSSEIPALSL